jgi:hypothetical protein
MDVGHLFHKPLFDAVFADPNPTFHFVADPDPDHAVNKGSKP